MLEPECGKDGEGRGGNEGRVGAGLSRSMIVLSVYGWRGMLWQPKKKSQATYVIRLRSLTLLSYACYKCGRKADPDRLWQFEWEVIQGG